MLCTSISEGVNFGDRFYYWKLGQRMWKILYVLSMPCRMYIPSPFSKSKSEREVVPCQRYTSSSQMRLSQYVFVELMNDQTPAHVTLPFVKPSAHCFLASFIYPILWRGFVIFILYPGPSMVLNKYLSYEWIKLGSISPELLNAQLFGKENFDAGETVSLISLTALWLFWVALLHVRTVFLKTTNMTELLKLNC